MLSGLRRALRRGGSLWHGKSLDGASPNAAIVFQSFALFPWLTVVENVEVPLLARGVDHVDRHRRALKTLHAPSLMGLRKTPIPRSFRVA